MAVPVLEAIADAIMRFEGWEPGSRSYRNRNPGNLRLQSPEFARDSDGYNVFPSFGQGYEELVRELHEEVAGQNHAGINANSSLLELFSVYAPTADQNQPQRYASFVADWLCRVYLRGDIYSRWTFTDIFAAVKQELPHA
ncbi:MAG: hypothetical protein ACRD4Q_00095 [Candidatus Acidiferrales bacterium]